MEQNPADAEKMTKGDEIRARALGFRTTANDLQAMLNTLTSGNSIAPANQMKVFGYFLSITVLRALSAECMLKAIACERTGSFQHEHNLSTLLEALDGKTKGFIERIADSHGVASPKRVLKRHRNDFVEWRYPTGQSQSTELLDLDKALQVLDDVYLRIKAGKGP